MKEIRAKVKQHENGEGKVNVWYVDLYFYGEQEPTTYVDGLTKEQADLIADRINRPDPLEIIRKLKETASPLQYECLEKIEKEMEVINERK